MLGRLKVMVLLVLKRINWYLPATGGTVPPADLPPPQSLLLVPVVYNTQNRCQVQKELLNFICKE
jgi:hypothetical protein